MQPRVRSGYALKRLDATEGSKRWVLKDLNRGTFLRLSDNDARLFELFDGDALAGRSHRRCRAALRRGGPARLARLLPTSASAASSPGVTARTPTAEAPRASAPAVQAAREDLHRARRRFEALYRRGGWVLFTRPALFALAVLIVAGWPRSST